MARLTGIPFLTGLRVTQSIHATIEKPNFPPSKNRSKRIHKKLLKRLGTIRVPTAIRMGDNLFVHPDIYRAVQRAARESEGTPNQRQEG